MIRDLLWGLVIVILIVLALMLPSGCASLTPACTWHPVSRQELNDRCENWSGKVLGCQTGTDRCDLWVLKPEGIQ